MPTTDRADNVVATVGFTPNEGMNNNAIQYSKTEDKVSNLEDDAHHISQSFSNQDHSTTGFHDYSNERTGFLGKLENWWSGNIIGSNDMLSKRNPEIPAQRYEAQAPVTESLPTTATTQTADVRDIDSGSSLHTSNFKQGLDGIAERLGRTAEDAKHQGAGFVEEAKQRGAGFVEGTKQQGADLVQRLERKTEEAKQQVQEKLGDWKSDFETKEHQYMQKLQSKDTKDTSIETPRDTSSSDKGFLGSLFSSWDHKEQGSTATTTASPHEIQIREAQSAVDRPDDHVLSRLAHKVEDGLQVDKKHLEAILGTGLGKEKIPADMISGGVVQRDAKDLPPMTWAIDDHGIQAATRDSIRASNQAERDLWHGRGNLNDSGTGIRFDAAERPKGGEESIAAQKMDALADEARFQRNAPTLFQYDPRVDHLTRDVTGLSTSNTTRNDLGGLLAFRSEDF